MSIKVLNVSFGNFAFFVKNFRMLSKISSKFFSYPEFVCVICPKFVWNFSCPKKNWTKSGHEKILDSKYNHFSGRFPDIFETSAQFPDVFQVQHPTKKDLT